MPDIYEDVKAFFAGANQQCHVVPNWPAELELRVNLIAEEHREFHESVENDDFPGTIDACIDLIYVTVGFLVAAGVPFQQMWDLVQAANMKKFEGPKSAEGKQLKPEGWQPPDIEGALIKLGWEKY